MDKLCEKGMIERRRCDHDRRVVFVNISKKGLDLLEQIDLSDFDLYLNRLTEKEASILNELLDKIR